LPPFVSPLQLFEFFCGSKAAFQIIIANFLNKFYFPRLMYLDQVPIVLWINTTNALPGGKYQLCRLAKIRYIKGKRVTIRRYTRVGDKNNHAFFDSECMKFFSNKPS